MRQHEPARAQELRLNIVAWSQRRPALAAVLGPTVLVVLFAVFDRLLLRAAQMPESAFHRPVLVLALVERVGLPVVGIAVIALALLAWRGGLFGTWEERFGDRVLRPFVVFCALLLAWPLATQGFNPYLQQAHLFDIAAMLALVVALWFRPWPILPLVAVLAILTTRLAVPELGGSILAHKLQVFHVLSLFAAALLLSCVAGTRTSRDYVYVVVCMVAGAYFTAALAKIEIHWWQADQLHLLPVSAFGHGWLDFLGPQGIGSLATALKPVGPLMLWAVLALEAGCLLIMYRRSLALAILSALVAFHFGVLLLYGFFFWTWIGLDLALILLLLRRENLFERDPARGAALAMSVVLIATALLWARPPNLGWLDTGLTYTYRLEARGRSGSEYQLRPGFFHPYEDVFTMVPFSYLQPTHGLLTGSYGVTKDGAIAAAIAGARSREDILALERSLGSIRYDASRAERLKDFVVRMVEARNAGLERSPLLAALAPPGQFISQRPGIESSVDDPLVTVRIVEVTTRFDGHVPQEIRRSVLAVIPIAVQRDDTARQ